MRGRSQLGDEGTLFYTSWWSVTIFTTSKFLKLQPGYNIWLKDIWLKKIKLLKLLLLVPKGSDVNRNPLDWNILFMLCFSSILCQYYNDFKLLLLFTPKLRRYNDSICTETRDFPKREECLLVLPVILYLKG